MESMNSNARPDDGLELERVAVGPYCVFDDYKPSPPSSKNQDDSRENTEKMEDPMLSTDFTFGDSMQAPWLTASADDYALAAAQSAEPYTNGTWEDWMRWDGTTQAPSPKSFNAQGPVCFLKPNQQKMHLPMRRPNSNQLGQQSGASSTPIQAPSHNIPFGFGENMPNQPAFQFNGNPISSPAVTKEETQQNAYFTTPTWDQNKQGENNENGLFSPLSFDQSQMGNVAIPPQSTPSLHHSPESTNMRTSSSSSQSSPEPGPSNSKKRRKSSADEGDTDTKQSKQPVKKTAHNMIEKRYRTNLNDKIAALRDSVPSLRVMSRTGDGQDDDEGEDLEGLTPAHKLNKATVLSKATEYIRHLEKRNKRLLDEVAALKARLDSYDKLAMTMPMAAMANHVPTPDGLRYQEDPFAAAAAQGPMQSQAQGMIPVPENLANLRRMQQQNQQHFASQQGGFQAYPNGPNGNMNGQQMVNGRGGNMMSKLMVGSLAGLMIMEGFSGSQGSAEDTDSKGLFAVPAHLARRMAPFQDVPVQHSYFGLLKFFFLLVAVLYVVAPLFTFKPKPKKKIAAAVRLTPAPSVALPVEVRRKAWLTAIQTVWVPQHNFILEVAALGLKTLKLSIRRIIGWPGYVFLTGITKDQEAARVRAWEIALDAQLTGGDAEISLSRLILTLIASGTLPDTPARLMLKAMHIRVLLWEVAKAGYGTWYMFDEISAKLARSYWNAARKEHNALLTKPSKDKEEERLPEHLAGLLELECDEVLIPTIIQRAYNLAWNRPSAENTDPDETMDGVINDLAIASPLDALAAWSSSHTLSRSLVGYLATKDATADEGVKQDLELAIRTSPPASGVQLRALVAKAVLLDEDRDASITTAFDALPSKPKMQKASSTNGLGSPAPAVLMNIVSNTPVTTDIHISLTLAKCLALASLSLSAESSVAGEALLRATQTINAIRLPETSLTLLSFVAAYKTFNTLLGNDELLSQTHEGLERLALAVRVWVGREAARKSGLSSKSRASIVEKCLKVSKMLVGMNDLTPSETPSEEGDAGYVSQSEGERDKLGNSLLDASIASSLPRSSLGTNAEVVA